MRSGKDGIKERQLRDAALSGGGGGALCQHHHILTKTAIVELRIVRNQVVGDKISARNSQKCTIASIEREYFQPRCIEEGWSPDVSANSLCIMGRVTVSYELMIKSGVIGARMGKVLPGEPGEFKKPAKYMGTHGNTQFRLTGLHDHLPRAVTCGPVYIQALRHHVKNKKMGRNYGKVHSMTRAPIRGRCWNGGLLQDDDRENDEPGRHSLRHLLQALRSHGRL